MLRLVGALMALASGFGAIRYRRGQPLREASLERHLHAVFSHDRRNLFLRQYESFEDYWPRARRWSRIELKVVIAISVVMVVVGLAFAISPPS